MVTLHFYPFIAPFNFILCVKKGVITYVTAAVNSISLTNVCSFKMNEFKKKERNTASYVDL